MILPVSSVEILQVFWRRFLQHNSGVPIHPFISVWRGYYHTHNSGISIHPFISVYREDITQKVSNLVNYTHICSHTHIHICTHISYNYVY